MNIMIQQPLRIGHSRPLSATGQFRMADITKPEALDRCRQKFYQNHPRGGLLLEVHQRLERGDKLDPKFIDEACQTICTLKTKEIEKLGVDHRLANHFNLTLLDLVTEAYSLLGIVREDFDALDWKTPGAGEKNVRYRVFKYNPGLKERVEKAEAELLRANDLRSEDIDRLNSLRIEVISLVTTDNLTKWGLSGYNNRKDPCFRNVAELIAKCFPFTVHSSFASFRQTENIQQIKAQATKSANKQALTSALTEFKATFDRSWQIARYYRAKNLQLTDEQFGLLFKDLVLNAKQTRAAIRDEMLFIKDTVGSVNESVVQLNSRWVKTYSIKIFDDLFQLSCTNYLRTVIF